MEALALEQKKKQKLFTAVVRYARKMEGKSVVGANDNCKYRVFAVSKKGKATKKVVNACFIGGVFPTRLYSPGMENRVANVILNDEYFPELTAYWDGKGYSRNRCFLGMLQRAHDSAFDTREAAFQCIARDEGLTIPVLIATTTTASI